MYAVVKVGGRQYQVREGDRLRVEKIDAPVGDSVEFSDVLLVADGENVRIGTPCLPGAKVTAQVREHGRERKILVVKFRRRKNYLRRRGHRQPYSEMTITNISAGG